MLWLTPLLGSNFQLATILGAGRNSGPYRDRSFVPALIRLYQKNTHALGS
jgi:hypothetical protein